MDMLLLKRTAVLDSDTDGHVNATVIAGQAERRVAAIETVLENFIVSVKDNVAFHSRMQRCMNYRQFSYGTR